MFFSSPPLRDPEGLGTLFTAKPGKDIDVDRLRRIFEQFVDTDGSPVAIALASIAVNSGGVQKSEGGEIAGEDVGGGAAGGVLGGIGGAILLGAISSFGAAAGQGVGGWWTSNRRGEILPARIVVQRFQPRVDTENSTLQSLWRSPSSSEAKA